MNRWRWLAGILAIGAVAAMTGVASAGRVPGARSEGQKSSGSRVDITVPYLTTGNTAFMAGAVAPRLAAQQFVACFARLFLNAGVRPRMHPAQRPVRHAETLREALYDCLDLYHQSLTTHDHLGRCCSARLSR